MIVDSLGLIQQYKHNNLERVKKALISHPSTKIWGLGICDLRKQGPTTGTKRSSICHRKAMATLERGFPLWYDSFRFVVGEASKRCKDPG
jgi:hypothetical protein